MPQHKSCKKRLKTADRSRMRNNAFKTNFRKALKSARQNIDEGTELDMNLTYAEIDRAYSKGLIHRNKAARLKSRLSKAAARKVEKKA